MFLFWGVWDFGSLERFCKTPGTTPFHSKVDFFKKKLSTPPPPVFVKPSGSPAPVRSGPVHPPPALPSGDSPSIQSLGVGRGGHFYSDPPHSTPSEPAIDSPAPHRLSTAPLSGRAAGWASRRTPPKNSFETFFNLRPCHQLFFLCSATLGLPQMDKWFIAPNRAQRMQRTVKSVGREPVCDCFPGLRK